MGRYLCSLFAFFFFSLFFLFTKRRKTIRKNQQRGKKCSFEVRPWQKIAHKQGQPLNSFHIVLDLRAASVGYLGTNLRKRKI